MIHANERDRRSTEITIKEGAAVRERQSLIQLPDLTRMQVKAKIHETKVELLKIGMPARITANVTPATANAPAFPQSLSALPPGFTLPRQSIAAVDRDFETAFARRTQRSLADFEASLNQP